MTKLSDLKWSKTKMITSVRICGVPIIGDTLCCGSSWARKLVEMQGWNFSRQTDNCTILESVFSEIRVRTWVKKQASELAELSGLPIRGLFFWRETSTWNHVMTRISEKTDFSIVLKHFLHIRSILHMYYHTYFLLLAKYIYHF